MRAPSLRLLCVLALLASTTCARRSDPPLPRILSVIPDEGTVTGGTNVRIVAGRFRDDFTLAPPIVTFDRVEATSVTALAADEILAVTPPHAGAGPVDVQVATTLSPETAIRRKGFSYLPSPPRVTGIDPPDGSVDVAPTRILSVTFDREMDPGAFGTGSILLDGTAAGPIPALGRYLPGVRTLEAFPVDPFPLGETMTVTLSASVRDLEGRALGAPESWSFRTTSDPAHLLITEVAVTDFAQEFIEIHNPTNATVPLAGYALADSTWVGPPAATQYYLIPEAIRTGSPLIGTSDDFVIGFPAGASIDPGEYQSVALAGSVDFSSAWGLSPTYEISDDGGVPDAIPDMVPIAPGSTGSTARLTNGGEIAVLFFWNGLSDRVWDVDYVIWGDAITDPSTPEAVDKTGVSLDGPDPDALTSTYRDDTPTAMQEVVDGTAHAPGRSYQRLLPLIEPGEIGTGGCGVTGHDETSEWLGIQSGGWTSGAAATPNLPGP